MFARSEYRTTPSRAWSRWPRLRTLETISSASVTAMVKTVVDALALFGHANEEINQRRREDQKGDLNQAYKSLGKMDKCHHSLLYGDNLAKRVKSINDTNGVAQSLTAGSSGTHRGGQLRWNTGHNETYFVAQSRPVAFLWVFVRSGLPTLKPWKVVLRSGASEITFAIESFPYGTVYPHML